MFEPQIVCKHGHNHRVFIQKDPQSCGISCCAMILLRKQGKVTTELDLFMKNGFKQATRRPDIVSLLSKLGIECNEFSRLSPSQMKSHVRAATPQRPVIAAVTWANQNTGHWVLIEGRTKTGFNRSSSYCICDPTYGYLTTSLSKGSEQLKFKAGLSKFPGLLYSPKDGVHGLFTGTLIVPK